MMRFMDASFSDQSVAVALRVLKRAELEAVSGHGIPIIDPSSEDRLWERKRMQWAQLAVEPIEGTTVPHTDAEKRTAATVLSVSVNDIEQFHWNYVGHPNAERQRARESVRQQIGSVFSGALRNFAAFCFGLFLGFNRKN